LLFYNVSNQFLTVKCLRLIIQFLGLFKIREKIRMAYNKIFDGEKILFLREFNRMQGLEFFILNMINLKKKIRRKI